MPIDIILYALAALALILALRHVLGTRHGDERSRPNPFVGPPVDAASAAPAPIALSGPPGNSGVALPRTLTVLSPAQDGLNAIAKADKTFDLARFAQGAQEAFVKIVEAFAQGDRAFLQDKLTSSVFQAFDGVISAREQAGEQASVEILAVRRLEITAAAMTERVASITIRFVADETLVLRDKDGQIKQGNPDRVTETIDIWIFTRDRAAKADAWRVSATREEAAVTDVALPTVG